MSNGVELHERLEEQEELHEHLEEQSGVAEQPLSDHSSSSSLVHAGASDHESVTFERVSDISGDEEEAQEDGDGEQEVIPGRWEVPGRVVGALAAHTHNIWASVCRTVGVSVGVPEESRNGWGATVSGDAYDRSEPASSGANGEAGDAYDRLEPASSGENDKAGGRMWFAALLPSLLPAHRRARARAELSDRGERTKSARRTYVNSFFLVIATILGTGVLALPAKLQSGIGPFLALLIPCFFFQAFVLIYMIELLQKVRERDRLLIAEAEADLAKIERCALRRARVGTPAQRPLRVHFSPQLERSVVSNSSSSSASASSLLADEGAGTQLLADLGGSGSTQPQRSSVTSDARSAVAVVVAASTDAQSDVSAAAVVATAANDATVTSETDAATAAGEATATVDERQRQHAATTELAGTGEPEERSSDVVGQRIEQDAEQRGEEQRGLVGLSSKENADESLEEEKEAPLTTEGEPKEERAEASADLQQQQQQEWDVERVMQPSELRRRARTRRRLAALRKQGPDLHRMGVLFLDRWSRKLFMFFVYVHFFAILIAYALAGGESFALFIGHGVQTWHAVIPFVLVLAFAITVLRGLLKPFVSLLTFLKGTLLVLMVGTVAIVAASSDVPYSHDLSQFMSSFLIGCLALGGAVNTLPIGFKNVAPVRKDVRKFKLTVVAALFFVFIIISAWCLCLLRIVPQHCDTNTSAAVVQRAASSAHSSGVGGAGEEGGTSTLCLDYANEHGEISTVPLVGVIEQEHSKYMWIAVLVDLFTTISVIVSFVVMGLGLTHALDGMAISFAQSRRARKERARRRVPSGSAEEGGYSQMRDDEDEEEEKKDGRESQERPFSGSDRVARSVELQEVAALSGADSPYAARESSESAEAALGDSMRERSEEAGSGDEGACEAEEEDAEVAVRKVRRAHWWAWVPQTYKRVDDAVERARENRIYNRIEAVATARWTFYVCSFGFVLLFSVTNAEAFLWVMESVTSFALNFETGVFICVMLWIARRRRVFRLLEIPSPTSRPLFLASIPVATYFLAAVAYDIYKNVRALSGQ